MPRLSVIVPIYDVEPYLAACLESLACQTWRDVEVVMVDDGSPDAAAEIAGRFAERDHRFRLVRQANAGLGAARNAGLRVASGEFHAFVDSDDMLPLHALEIMAATLGETGSDLVAGNVHRFNGRGARQSPMHREVFAEEAPRTHITRRTSLLEDRLVTNKLWRRSFWEEHALRFPEGVLYEDTSVALRAHFLARAVDVIARPVYLWRERDGDTLSITQDRTSVKGLEDRFAAVTAVRRFLLDHGCAAHVPAWDLTVLDRDLPPFVQALERAGEAFRERFCDLAGHYLDAVDPRVFARIPAPRRARWHLVRERRLPELLEFLEWERTVRPDARVVRRLYRYHLDTPVPLPPRVTRMREELEIRQRIDDVRWDRGRLSVEGRVTLRHLSPAERRHQRVFAWFVRQDTGRRIRVPVTTFKTVSMTSRDSEDWCGFRFALDPRGLGEQEATWHVELWVLHRGMLRRGRLREPDPSAAGRLEHHEPRPRVRAWPYRTEAGELRVRVERERARAVACEPDGDRLLLSGPVTGDLGPDPVLLVTRAEGGVPRRYPIEMAQGAFRVAVGLEDLLSPRPPVLPASSPETRTLDATAEWRFEVEGAGVLAAGVECRHVHAGRDLTVGGSASGALVLREHASAFRVEGARWTEEGHLELSGTASGDEPAHLVLISHSRFDEHSFPLRPSGGRFTVTVNPHEVVSLAGRLPLPSGTYGMAVRSGDVEGRVVCGLDAPVRHEFAHRRLSFGGDAEGAPVLTVGGDLRGEAQDVKMRRMLRGRLYPRLRAQEPLREAVLFDCHEGRRFAGNPRAIYEELRREGAALEFLWSVADGQVALPEGVIPVAMSSREHFEAMATCRYVVVDGALPKWFRRREGQTVLQTAHGTPIKRVGLDVDRGPLAAPGHRERLARESGQWSHLLSPGPWCTPILRAAFGFAGEILETGYPRNDALARPGPVAAIRERLGLPEGGKVVLYAPTWREDRYHGKGCSRFDLRFDPHRMWSRLGEDHVVLVRRHPNTFDRVPRAGTDFVVDVSAYPDIRDLYPVADVLVTDYSSVMSDFAVTGRPILLYAYDLEHYRDEVRGLVLDVENEAPGPLLRTTAEVAEAIRSLDRVSAEYAGRYRDFAARFCPLDDGGAAARVVERVFGARRAGAPAIPRQSRKAIHDRLN